MNHTRERKKPNLSLTEADYCTMMDEFLAGATDAELARKWGVSPATVAAQRFKRGVYRRDRTGPRVKDMVRRDLLTAAIDAGEVPAAGAANDDLRLILPADGDPVAAGDALLAHSLKLGAAGRIEEALAVGRLARSHFLSLGARGRVLQAAANDDEDEAEALPPAPTLRPAQTPPEGDWRTWLFLGGRGAGKTLAGAAWLAGRAKTEGRLALVGPTLGDVREVMIDGPSGLRGLAAAFGPPGGLPVYEPSRRRLLWPNGATAQVFSAEDPDSLRGPQFAAAWADELCAWPKGE